ncbi:unnamed protein product [Bursaphelenchus okinawaensis]|uniref:Uncharacterized protein n=1 Tax=Bursaphelenchus okinawaensis TaxID=465554 RepID=A0A811K9E2_9BILA|nr:unnamed protein product [Bursaphelenchus okinawaensis]CAG9095071.1 unnamed protein product [Bursaphelenchus okinawaensis]
MSRKETLPPERDPPAPPSLLSLPTVSQAPDELALTIDPPRAWFTTLGGVSRHLLCNHGPDRLAMKVRCSNNHAFRVNPVFLFLGEGHTQEFELIRLQGGEPRKDKVQLLFTVARYSDEDPASLFGQNAKSEEQGRFKRCQVQSGEDSLGGICLYDSFQAKPNVVPMAADSLIHVWKWFNRTLDRGVSGLQAEFAEMKRYCPKDMDVKTFNANWEAGRCRYKDVPCQEAARVILKWPGLPYDFIHANYVPAPKSQKRYICTQGPLESTVADFWRMIVQEETDSIIMLCNCIEKGMDKCAQYWPSQLGQTVQYDGDKLTVTSGSISPLTVNEQSVARTLLTLKWKMNGKQNEREVRHFQWVDWPDRGVPNGLSTVFDLLSAVRGSEKPIVVHCSAGIGRTGSIVSIAYIMERFQLGHPCEDMPEIFRELRNSRPYSIQKEVQYLFVHRVILYYFAERKGNFPPTDARYVKFVEEYNKAVC